MACMTSEPLMVNDQITNHSPKITRKEPNKIPSTISKNIVSLYNPHRLSHSLDLSGEFRSDECTGGIISFLKCIVL
jgi:hypothetical protein